MQRNWKNYVRKKRVEEACEKLGLDMTSINFDLYCEQIETLENIALASQKDSHNSADLSYTQEILDFMDVYHESTGKILLPDLLEEACERVSENIQNIPDGVQNLILLYEVTKTHLPTHYWFKKFLKRQIQRII